jgi:hypothetical protein
VRWGLHDRAGILAPDNVEGSIGDHVTILAAVPPAERKDGDQTIWGVRRILAGALVVALGALGGLAVWRIMKADSI